MGGKYISPNFVVLAVCCLMASFLFAAPFNPNERRVVINDGDSLTLQDLGDEFYSVTKTDDGFLVIRGDSNLYYYADENSEPSKFKARNANKRDGEEKKFLKGLDRKKTFTAHWKKHQGRSVSEPEKRRPARAPWVPTVLPKSHHSNGKLRFPIILVEVNGGTNLDSAELYAVLNQENYRKKPYLGSVRDYFVDQSSGVFVPQFDLYFVSYSDSVKRDDSMYGFLERVVQLMLDKYPSFDESLYDSDNDGMIDTYGVLYTGGWIELGSRVIKGLQFLGRLNVTSKGGKLFQNGFLSCQGYNYYSTLIHEFSHTMGLKDHYCAYTDPSVDYRDASYPAPGTLYWDVMGDGVANTWDSLKTPPNYSAFERNFMGWLEYTPIEEGKPVKILPPLGTNNVAYFVKVNENEWYIFENRQKVKWDIGLPYHGMLVWHIDYDLLKWSSDKLNSFPAHQRVDIVEAGNWMYKSYGDSVKLKDDPFPGMQNVTKLSPVLSWAGDTVLNGLFNIMEADTNVCFSLSPDVSTDECKIFLVSSSSKTSESSSSESSSSSVETLKKQISIRNSGFHVVVEGKTLLIDCPEQDFETVHVFDLQGRVIAATTFTGTSYRLNLGEHAYGTSFVVRIKSRRGLMEYFRISP